MEKIPIPVDNHLNLDRSLLLKSKQQGFSDFQIARCIWKEKMDDNIHIDVVRKYRKWLSIMPSVKQIDTLAGLYPSKINYLYLTYNSTIEHDVNFENDGRSVIVLGSGVYRIGSSVEFD